MGDLRTTYGLRWWHYIVFSIASVILITVVVCLLAVGALCAVLAFPYLIFMWLSRALERFDEAP